MPLDHDQIVAISQAVSIALESVAPESIQPSDRATSQTAGVAARARATSDNRKFRHAVVRSHLSGELDRLRVAGRWD